MNGIYVLEYSGTHGAGHGGLTIMGDTVRGLAHGPFNIGGTLAPRSDGSVRFQARLMALAPADLVTGAQLERGDPVHVDFILRAEHFGGQPFRIDVQGEPVDVRLQRLAAL